jgi:heptosyltransferase-2
LQEWEIRADDLLVGIHPGARIAVRRWELEKFAKVGELLLEQVGAKVVVFCDEQGYGADIPMRQRPVFFRGSLREMMALIQCCHLLVCNDSGPMHLATGVGTRIVGIFGPTLPALFGPYGSGHRVVIQDGFPCRPCFDRCIYDQPYCLTTITVDEVLLVIEGEIARIRRSRLLETGLKQETSM